MWQGSFANEAEIFARIKLDHLQQQIYLDLR